MKYVLIFIFIFGIAVPISSTAADAEGSRHHNVADNGLALQGYDPVSYFSGLPLMGKPKYRAAHGGIQYQFFGKKSMAQFNLAPEKYLPAYGGWCAWAMLDGEKVAVNPQRFKVIDGINYLYYDGFWGNTLKKWNKLAGREGDAVLVRRAGEHWQKIVSE
jgi:hypothetical protein